VASVCLETRHGVIGENRRSGVPRPSTGRGAGLAQTGPRLEDIAASGRASVRRARPAGPCLAVEGFALVRAR